MPNQSAKPDYNLGKRLRSIFLTLLAVVAAIAAVLGLIYGLGFVAEWISGAFRLSPDETLSILGGFGLVVAIVLFNLLKDRA